MNKKTGVLMAALLVGAVLAVSFVAWRGAAGQHKLVKIGGDSNQCDCTHRIELPDDSWF